MIYMRMFANTKNQQKNSAPCMRVCFRKLPTPLCLHTTIIFTGIHKIFSSVMKGASLKRIYYSNKINAWWYECIFFQFRLYFGGHVIHKQKTSGEIFIIEGDKYHFLILCGLKNLIVDEATKTDTFLDLLKKELRNLELELLLVKRRLEVLLK